MISNKIGKKKKKILKIFKKMLKFYEIKLRKQKTAFINKSSNQGEDVCPSETIRKSLKNVDKIAIATFK